MAAGPDAGLSERLRLDTFKRPAWIFDLDSWRILAANAAAVHLWNRRRLDELLQADFSEHSPAVAERLQSYRRRFEAGETVEEDWTFYPPGGPVAARCLCSHFDLPGFRAAMLVEATVLSRTPAEGVTRSLEALRHAGAAVAMFGSDGRLIAANPAAHVQLGWRDDEPCRLADVFSDPKHGAEAIAWAEGGAIFDDEAVLRTPLGDRWFALRLNPAHDPASGERALVVSATDINERRRTERLLSESEQARVASERQARELAAAQRRAAEAERTLREAIESLDQGFLLVDRDDRIVLANRRYAELYPALTDLLQPGAIFHELIQRFAELEGLEIDGSADAWVEWRIRQMRERQGHFWEQNLRDGRTFLVNERETASGTVVSLRTDITPIKRTQAALHERVLAIEAANDGIAMTDASGAFIFMNPAHAAMFGGTPDDFLGRPWECLYDPEVVRMFREDHIPDLIAAGTWRGETEGRKLDGSRLEQEVSLSLLETGGLLCVTRDIGERRAAEAERNRLQTQLFQSQKMDSLGRLAGGIAHDFNNILASMLGYAAFLQEDLMPDSEQARYAGAIVAAGKRAQDLISQILAFGRPREVSRDMVRADEVVTETVQLLASTLPPTIRLSTDIPAGAFVVEGDRSQLIQVLMNLAVNARDSIGTADGRIDFSLRCHRPVWPKPRNAAKDGPEPETEVQLERERDGTGRLWLGQPAAGKEVVEFTVRDSGCGMPFEVMQSIFEPFFTTKKRGQGTGLGLAAVHGLVTGHGGAIAVESKPGRGTLFRILLPAAQSSAPATVETQQLRTGTYRILVVDDEEGVRSMLATGLARRGFATLEADSGASALRLLDSQTVDAVISDQTMPGMSGVELMRALHVHRPNLPVILCTGYSETLDAETAAAAGAAAFLRKPVSSDALIEVLSPLLKD